jgi:isopenicillin-N epimerase
MTDHSRRRFLVETGLSTAGLLALPGTMPRADANAEAAVPGAAEAAGDRWTEVRKQFLLSPDYVHMSTFFFTSHPKPVRDAIARFRDELDANPFDTWTTTHDDRSLRVKRAAAAYLGGRPEEVALTQSTTMGLSIAYHGIRLREGDEILTTTHDHYSQHESARFVCERSRATLRKIPLYDRFEDIPAMTEEQIVDRIRRAIKPATRVVGVTWVHSSSGLRLPLRAIADVIGRANASRDERDHALLVVDGVHGFGAVEERVAETGCDLFVAGTHKWIFGPRGTGLVWAPAKVWRPMLPLIPTFDSPELFDAHRKQQPPGKVAQAAWFTPGGFHSFEHAWAVADAFEFHASIGRKAIANRTHELNGHLMEGLAKIRRVKVWTPRSRALSAGIVTFDIDGLNPKQVVDRLRERKIIASVSPYARLTVRLSAGITSSEEDIEKTLRAVRESAA